MNEENMKRLFDHVSVSLQKFSELECFPKSTVNPLQFNCIACTKTIVVDGNDLMNAYVVRKTDPKNASVVSCYCCSMSCGEKAQNKLSLPCYDLREAVCIGMQEAFDRIPGTEGEITSISESSNKRLRGIVDNLVRRDGKRYEELVKKCEEKILSELESGTIPYQATAAFPRVRFIFSAMDSDEHDRYFSAAITSINKKLRENGLSYRLEVETLATREYVRIGLFDNGYKSE